MLPAGKYSCHLYNTNEVISCSTIGKKVNYLSAFMPPLKPFFQIDNFETRVYQRNVFPILKLTGLCANRSCFSHLHWTEEISFSEISVPLKIKQA
jgi:hypothetical protein